MAATVIATLAVVMSATGRPGSGMLGEEGRVVTYVLPGGPAWRSGVRVGQPLVAIEPGERAEDWSVTVDQGRITTISAALWFKQLRALLPIALVSAGAAAIAVLALGISRYAAVAIATGAIVVAQIPVMAQGDRIISTLVATVALVAPVVWLSARLGRSRARLGLVLLAFALGAAWVGSRFVWPDHYASLDMLRVASSWCALVAVVVTIGRREVWPVAGAYDRRRRTDALVLAVLAVAVAGALYSGTPAVPTLLVALLLVVAYPVVRGRVLSILDTAALGTVRERAALDAAGDERRRVAREIHDTAIQDLAALASRLERDLGSPGANAAGEVRGVTEQLRDITTRLASAELEDLGLGAALRVLVDRADRPGEMRVRLELVDDAAGEGQDIPDDVAVSVYRIAQEAIRNAQRHSGGSEVVVRAALAPDAIDLLVVDDGVGLDRVAMTAARERGHLGLTSMRQRASSIDAHLSVTGSGSGTRIALAWRR